MNAEDEQFYVKKQPRDQSTIECALVWRGLPASTPSPIPPVHFAWTETARHLIGRIRRVASSSGVPEGKELPYADLRAALQTRVPGMVLLESRLLPRDDGDPLFAANGQSGDVKAAAHKSIAAWCQLTLRPWVMRIGTDCGDVDLLETRALAGELLEPGSTSDLPRQGQVPDALRVDFRDFADVLLAIVAPELEGVELFPGLGPVYRVIDWEYGNSISFETWPSPLPGGGDDLFSMIAEISVETRPSSRLPFLVVRAAKRIWCGEFPTANQLHGRRRISVRVVKRTDCVRAASLSVRLERGIPQVDVNALLYETQRASDQTLVEDLPAIVRSRGRMPNLFVGVPFRYGYRPVPKIHAGVTLQDQVDLMRAVTGRIEKYGFEQSRLRILNRVPARSVESRLQANLHNLITHHFGQVAEDDVPVRVEELFGAPEKKTRGKAKPIKTVDLQPLREANRELLNRAFGAEANINLMFVCRREAEESIFRSVVELMFGDRINVVRHVMPEAVHGTRKAIDGEARLTRTQRAAARRAAWMPFAEQLRAEFPDSLVIVQAARKYDGIEEDSVNKDVGRNTLATVAGCNVQYLLPPAEGRAAEYMHRVQAALYDLLFGHAGLGPIPASLVVETFEEKARPKSIVGISVVSQAASRRGRPEGATLAVAMKIDVASGRIVGRIGRLKNGVMDRGAFQSLSRTLVEVASAGLTSIGDKQPDRRRNFVSFVRSVVDEVAHDDPNALILMESTTASSLWSWLKDGNISSEIYLEDATARPPTSWKSLRLVRVREKSAGRLASEARRIWIPATKDGEEREGEIVEEMYATAVERLVESLPEGNARTRHYLTAHGFNVRNQGARGPSAYRRKLGFRGGGASTPKGKRKFSNKVLSRRHVNDVWHAPSRIPVTLEITVLPSKLGDNEDAVATLVSALRNGYSHTADGTFLPAPLSFRSKILDYMDRYASGPEEDDPDDRLSVDEEVSQDEDNDERAIGYGETRRWFEGVADFNDADIPFDDEPPDVSLLSAPLAQRATEIAPSTHPDHRTDLEAPARDENTQMVPTIRNQSLDGPETVAVNENNEIDALVDLLRSPVAPLPGFVDAEFLANAMHLVNSDIRHIHEDRDWVRAVTGFPWPEERPDIQDIPQLYMEALRYPAFAIVFQHQFFPDDKRGLPKSIIQQRNHDFFSRLRKERSISKHDADLSVLRALYAADNGGDRASLLAEMLGLPGQAAWRAPCAKASAGLDRLEARTDEWGELGRYLRAVVGPFARFGDERTIGEVIDELVIPYALTLLKALSVAPIPEIEANRAHDDGPTSDRKTSSEESPDHRRPTTLAEIGQQWRDECHRLVALLMNATDVGPTAEAVLGVREALKTLEDLEAQASQMTPATVSTLDFRDATQTLTAKVAKALNDLIGDDLGAPSLLSRLFDLRESAPAVDLEGAIAISEEAQNETIKAEGIREQVAAIEAQLPVKQARERTAPLLDKQEQLLRGALDLLGDALAALATTATEPIGVPQLVGSETSPIEPAADAQSEEPPLADVDPIAELERDAELQTEEDNLQVEDDFLPVVGSAPEDKELEAPAPDPLGREVAERLDHLFSLGEFGLAFHLSSAALSIMPQRDDLYTPVELRLASAGGRNIGLSAQDLTDLSERRSEALPIVQSLEGREDERSMARLSLLLVGALPAAFFRYDDVAAVLLVERIGRLPRFAHYAKLVSAVEENRKLNFPLTPANLMAVQAHAHERSFIDESVAAIKETIAAFRSTRFRFQAGERLKQALLRQDGLLGRIETQLSSDDQAVALETSDLFRGRNKIVAYIAKLAAEVEGASEIDAPSRERVFVLLSRIVQQCHDLMQATDGFAALRKSPGKVDAVKRLRDLVLSGISEARDHFRSPPTDRLTASAIRQADTVFETMRGVLQGIGVGDVPPLAVGLHSPLLWLQGLMWTGGWQPSPFVPEKILQEALAVPVPLVVADAVSSIHAAFEARRAESAFVPAYMLLNIAHWFGVGQELTDAWRAVLDTDKEVKKHQVKTWLQEAERTIDRMRRMAVGSLDQSARLKETLSTVNPENLPVELPPTFLPETLTGDRIEDFNSAIARIREVEAEAKREFDKSMSEYMSEIEELECGEKRDAETIAELRHLLGQREFTTLADRLNMLRTDQVWKPLLPSGAINVRLAKFKAALPQLGTVDLLQVARAIEFGKPFGPLDYGALDPEHRQQATSIARAFTKLKPPKNAGGSHITQSVSEVVSQLLFEVVRCDEDPLLTRPRQQIYVFDAKVSMPPADPASLLLPEFGTLTQGSWRICVVTSAISPQGLLDLADGAGHRGVLVLYRGVLNVERRAALRIDLIKRKRAMLVVDEAALAFAIADPSDRRRSIIDVTQGYSSADPYKDHGKSAVPPEMFKGRSWERSAIVDPFGSYVVFGGRRLGKTALLQQIHATQPSNAIFAYVDIDLVNDASDAFEQFSKTVGASVFKNPVRSGEDFASAIDAWLDADDRRRLLLLIDEADKFVLMEAETKFVCIQTLLKLMADTKNRFKFVLAGLHNVSRMVRVENSPLVQISNYPLQIGPLINRDVDDAEFLVRGPLAAMGFEFDKREDVWRILTFTNYYPVLIQVFCKELLSLIHDYAQKTGQLPAMIGTPLVERALSSSDVRSKLFETFYKTIGHIEGRYELLTYILAVRELRERESGMAAEGMTAAEVAERAMECWPACFPRGTDPNELEYLLEEMEGFGIARRTVAGTFALRSRSLLELMAATEADLERQLARYKTLKAPPKSFDPKNVRRAIGRPQPGLGGNQRISPLTDGQEADLLAPLQLADANVSPEAGFSGVGVIFGTEHAGIRFVEAALLDARRVKDKLVDVEIKDYGTKKEMLEDVKRPMKNQRVPKVIVISPKTTWRPDWVVEAERAGRVRKGEVRMIFIGDSGHAEEWSKDRTVLHRVLPQIKIVKLRPWARSYLGSRIESLHLSGDLVDLILQATGGWSEIAGPLLARIGENPSRAAALIERERNSALASPDLLDRLGIPNELVGFFKELAAYSDGSTVTTTDFQNLCTFDDRKISPRVVGIYSDLLGIISFPPDQSGHGTRKVDLNPLIHAALLASS